MSIINKYEQNKSVVDQWFRGFWGNQAQLNIVDKLLAPEASLVYPGRDVISGHQAIRQFMQGFRQAYPNLAFWQVGELIAEGDYVIGRFDGMGTHTGQSFNDPIVGVPGENSGLSIRLTGGSIRFYVRNGLIVEEKAQGQALTALPSAGNSWFDQLVNGF